MRACSLIYARSAQGLFTTMILLDSLCSKKSGRPSRDAMLTKVLSMATGMCTQEVGAVLSALSKVALHGLHKSRCFRIPNFIVLRVYRCPQRRKQIKFIMRRHVQIPALPSRLAVRVKVSKSLAAVLYYRIVQCWCDKVDNRKKLVALGNTHGQISDWLN